MNIKVTFAGAAFLLAFAQTCMSAPPGIYRAPANESMVRGGPDDLLMLAGYGFRADDRVVYRAIADATRVPTPPNGRTDPSTAEAGTAVVVSVANVPNSLTIKLPPALRVDQTYALWVRTARGEWSEAVLINDARPLWFTPATVYSTDSLGSLPRELKVVGRNLQASPGATTRIQLVGPETVTGTAITDADSSKAKDRYAARLRLPVHLAAGQYRVRLSRDGRSWIEVPVQHLEVRADEPAPREYAVSDPRFGGCRPDDGLDDSTCILQAVAAAKRDGGGVVSFGPGTWDLIDSSQRPGLVAGEGIIVDDGISLRGAGRGLTRVNRHPEWSSRTATAAFTLIGHTVVNGFTFGDLQEYHSEDLVKNLAGPFLELGEEFARVAAVPRVAAALSSVNDVVLTRNTFDKTFIAVGDAGLPLNRLIISENEFGAFYEALRLTGNRYNMAFPFRIDDSVIYNNVFKPGSLLDTARYLGSIASELGAGLRVDFSNNVADGHSREYLYRPDDPSGWRAAFFWALNNNVEELLVSGNSATCTGDKTGDGEAISYDNNGNTFAFPTVIDVEDATPTNLSVATPLLERQNSRAIPLQTYYSDHWIQVVSGPGLGQVRKIKSYTWDPVRGRTTFTVEPRWDVVPTRNKTRIAVGREYWQVYTVDNEVDQRQPLCAKSNRMRLTAGGIGMWAQSADSVIEGNRQFDTDGILTQQGYILPERPCTDCGMMGFFQYFLEIYGNTVDGEYAWGVDCSASGITTGIAAAPWDDPDPPTVGYGVSIAHNLIRRADAAQGGAIAQFASWYPGPKPERWALSDNQLIHHNSIREVDGPPALAKCGRSHPRIGINIPVQAIAWRTVLYANSCIDVAQPLERGGGVDTIAVCPPPGAPNSCECMSGQP